MEKTIFQKILRFQPFIRFLAQLKMRLATKDKFFVNDVSVTFGTSTETN